MCIRRRKGNRSDLTRETTTPSHVMGIAPLDLRKRDRVGGELQAESKTPTCGDQLI